MKTATKAQIKFKDLPKDYAGLCSLFLPRLVHDREQYLEVAEMADGMALWEEEFSEDQRDYFEMLCSLIESYDQQNLSRTKLQGVEMVKHLLEAHELTGADLSRLLKGSRNLGPMILRGERNLTLDHIKLIAEYFKVHPGLLIP